MTTPLNLGEPVLASFSTLTPSRSKSSQITYQDLLTLQAGPPDKLPKIACGYVGSAFVSVLVGALCLVASLPPEPTGLQYALAAILFTLALMLLGAELALTISWLLRRRNKRTAHHELLRRLEEDLTETSSPDETLPCPPK